MRQKTVVKPSLPKPGRVAVTACRFSRDGRVILAGLANGTIQLWDVKGAQRPMLCGKSLLRSWCCHPRSVLAVWVRTTVRLVTVQCPAGLPQDSSGRRATVLVSPGTWCH